MKLLTKSIRDRLIANGRIRQRLDGLGEDEPDFMPVVKLFTPDAGCTWLLTELDPDDPDIAFGLCDLGMGYPELGSVSLSELEAVRGKIGLPIERDLHFDPAFSLSVYASAALAAGAITEDRRSLEQAAVTTAGADPVCPLSLVRQLLEALDELVCNVEEDCPARYRTRHLVDALTQARSLISAAKAGAS